ncbi:PREDICTED: glutamate receptor ionotropic, kainate 2-like [Ceratosolen solmsi marchali]|uniref:Glutamate receptor ionotropic, kainate 2-like n=1 Tax=Ceratosolen solmsi marchali TaxID=326594 RepID=A0AAJ6YR88_9HYME|nr:PREDICTED: glutamate receptor ionotropic, kainate 2-like [Ceratosolen solmsi marchali]
MEYEDLNFMTKAPPESNYQFKYYLPHHGMLKPYSTTTKLRMIFNGFSISTSGSSINDIMHTGPNLNPDKSNMTGAFRILWIVEQQVEVPYQLTIVTYGRKAAVFLEIRTLLQLVEDDRCRYPLAVPSIGHGRYVHDIFRNTDSPEQLIKECAHIPANIYNISRHTMYTTRGILLTKEYAPSIADPYKISNIITIKEQSQYYVESKGLTGLITFDNAGFRSNFEIEIFKLTFSGIQVIGKWNSTRNIEWITDASIGIHSGTLSFRNTTFRVLIALTKPYGMLKETVFKMSGNDQYEGFAIDIIHEISKMLGFNYTFSVQTDNNYGSFNRETGHWNGMLKKIIDNEADLAITDLTITAERETAVDFTMPFMNLGISILYQKPKPASPSLMSFLLPFSTNVWLYLIGVYLIVSMLFFVIGRMCPTEWNNIYPCIEEPEELENQFTIKNSLWFCIGAIMQQGSEIAPIGHSTRMLAGCWWFFCLIMVSSYTANLAAFLTVETVERPIKNAEDLANQDVIRYGAKKGGSTLGFFKDSNSSTYSKMYQYMIDNAKEVLTSDNDEGKIKTINENYAFLMESSSIDYIQERECNLTQIGGLLDQKGYGIAMRKNATYRNELSGAVLKLQEMGILTALKNKWWKEKGGGGHCQEDSGGGQAEELGLANVGGVFLVLIVGVSLSFFD